MSDSWVPLAVVGGLGFLAIQAYRSSRTGPTGLSFGLPGLFWASEGIGVSDGGGGGGLFGEGAGVGTGGESDKQTGTQDTPGGDGGSGDEPTNGSTDGDAGTGTGGTGSTAGDGGATGGSGGAGGGAGGVGGGSGGGIGSGQGQGSGGDFGEGGNDGEDDGGGEGDGLYDPWEGLMIDQDLSPPDRSKSKINELEKTVEMLVQFAVLDTGTLPDLRAKLPPQLHTFNPELGGVLKYWADVAIHSVYSLPEGRLDPDVESHKAWIKLWIDILAHAAKFEAWTNKDSVELLAYSTSKRYRGMAPSEHFQLREMPILRIVGG